MATDPILLERQATIDGLRAEVQQRVKYPGMTYIEAGQNALTLIRDAVNWRPRALTDDPLAIEGVQVVYRPSMPPDEWRLVRVAPLDSRSK